MANLSAIIKIPATGDINSAYDFSRGGDMTHFKLGNEMRCEIYKGVASAANNQLPTGFSRVLGGYVVDLATGLAVPGAAIIPLATDSSQADITGLTNTNTYIVVVYGQ